MIDLQAGIMFLGFASVGVLLCSCVGSASAAESAPQPNPDKLVVYKTVGNTSLKLHVFFPPDFKPSDKHPAIVFFFGGGWVSGSPRQFYPQCAYFASRGMVALSAEYRVESRDKTTPKECVKDGKSAIRWIRQHAGELGIDPQMLAAGGGSAGGHVAAATGTVKEFNETSDDLSIDCRPNALVLFNPVIDIGPGGYENERVNAYWKEISPKNNLDAQTPPTVVFLGTRDKYIPVETARKYKKLMEENGRRCDLHLYENQEHGFFNSKENFTLTVIEADRFLASLGFLKGEPALKDPAR